MESARKTPRILLFLVVLVCALGIAATAGAVTTLTMSEFEKIPDVHIQILSNQELGVCVMKPGGVKMPGVVVTITSPLLPSGKTATTSSETSTATFKFDEFVNYDPGIDYFYGSIKVMNGTTEYFSADKMFFKRGTPRYIYPNQKNSDPYVSKFTYNKFDLITDQHVIDISPKNDGNQIISVVVENVSGGVTAELRQGETVLKTAEGSASGGKVTFDLSGKWNQIFKVGSSPIKDPINLRIRANGRTLILNARLITQQAYVESPFTPGNIGFSVKDGAVTVTIPRQSKIFGGQEVTVKIPDCPVQFYVDTSGKVMLGVSFSTSPVKYDNRKDANPEAAKTANKEETEKWMEKTIKDAQAEVDRVKNGLAMMNTEGGTRPYTETFKIEFAFAVAATGKYDSKTELMDMELRFAVSVTGKYNHTWYFSIYGIPAYINFGASVSASLSMTSKYDIDKNFKWTQKGKDVFEIGLGFKMSLAAGAGIRGVLDFYTEGGGGMDANIAFSTTTDANKPFPHYKATANFYIKIGYNIIFKSGSWKILDMTFLLADNWDRGKQPREIIKSGNEDAPTFNNDAYLADLDEVVIATVDASGAIAFDSACVGDFAAIDTTTYEKATAGKTRYAANFAADTDAVAPSSVTPVVKNTFPAAQYKQLLIYDEFPIAFYVAAVQHADGKVYNSLLWNLVDKGKLLTDPGKCGVITGFTGHIAAYDVYIDNVALSDRCIINISLTYRDPGNTKHYELFYTTVDVKLTYRNAGVASIQQNAANNKGLYGGYWGGAEYSLLLPQVCGYQENKGYPSTVIVAFLMQYNDYYEDKWLDYEKPHLYLMIKKDGVWTEKPVKYAILEGSLTDMDFVKMYHIANPNDHIGFAMMTLVNQDKTLKTTTNQKLTVRNFNIRTQTWDTLPATVRQGDIHSAHFISAGTPTSLLYAMGDELYGMSISYNWAQGPKKLDVKLRTRSAQVVVGKRFSGTIVPVYLVWATNDKETIDAKLEATVWTQRLDLYINRNNGASEWFRNGKEFKLTELDLRVDQFAAIPNATNGFDLVFASAVNMGDSQTNIYYAAIPSVASVNVYGITAINPTVKMRDKVTFYADMENIGNQNVGAVRFEIKVSRVGAKDPIVYDYYKIETVGANIVASANEFNLDDLDEGETISTQDLDLTTGDSAPAKERALYTGDRHTYKFEYSCDELNRLNLTGVFKLEFKVVEVQKGADGPGTYAGEAITYPVYETYVMIPDTQTDTLVGVPDIGVDGWIYYVGDEPYLQVSVDSCGPTEVTADLEFLALDAYDDPADAVAVTRVALEGLGSPILDGSEMNSGNITLTMPLAAIFPDRAKTPDQLVLRLNNMNIEQASGNGYTAGDYSWWDNERVLTLRANTLFMFSAQPTNQLTLDGADAQFAVALTGGQAPYGYQWQTRASGDSDWMDLIDGSVRTNRSGKILLTSVSGVKTPTLRIVSVPLEWSGRQYRCIATDQAELNITSNAASLTVTAVPPITGDSARPELLIAVAVVCLIGVAAILVRRRSSRRENV